MCFFVCVLASVHECVVCACVSVWVKGACVCLRACSLTCLACKVRVYEGLWLAQTFIDTHTGDKTDILTS
jgi:hypothetical protein